MSETKKGKINIKSKYNDQVDLSFNNNNKKYSCSINNCGYKTDYKGNIDKHMKTRHLRDPKDLLYCTENGCTYKTFLSKKLYKHIKARHLRDPKDLLY